MEKRQDLIKYLCKRYSISAAMASTTLSQLGSHTLADLVRTCDQLEAEGKDVDETGPS